MTVSGKLLVVQPAWPSREQRLHCDSVTSEICEHTLPCNQRALTHLVATDLSQSHSSIMLVRCTVLSDLIIGEQPTHDTVTLVVARSPSPRYGDLRKSRSSSHLHRVQVLRAHSSLVLSPMTFAKQQKMFKQPAGGARAYAASIRQRANLQPKPLATTVPVRLLAVADGRLRGEGPRLRPRLAHSMAASRRVYSGVGAMR